MFKMLPWLRQCIRFSGSRLRSHILLNCRNNTLYSVHLAIRFPVLLSFVPTLFMEGFHTHSKQVFFHTSILFFKAAVWNSWLGYGGQDVDGWGEETPGTHEQPLRSSHPVSEREREREREKVRENTHYLCLPEPDLLERVRNPTQWTSGCMYMLRHYPSATCFDKTLHR